MTRHFHPSILIFTIFFISRVISDIVVTLTQVPSAIDDVSGVPFFGTILCDDGDDEQDPPGGGCAPNDQFSFELFTINGFPPSTKLSTLTIQFLDNSANIIVPLEEYPVTPKETSSDWVVEPFPINFPTTTEPSAIIHFNGFLTMTTLDLAVLSTKVMHLDAFYYPIAYPGQSVHNSFRFNWYLPGLSLDDSSILYVPQMDYSTPSKPVPNWTVEVVIKSVPFSPFQIDIHFFGGYSFTKYPTCVVNGNQRIKTYSAIDHLPHRGDTGKDQPIVDGTSISHLTMLLSTPGAEIIDKGSDMYIQCSGGRFSLPQSTLDNDWLHTSVIISSQESIAARYNTPIPVTLLPYVIGFPFNPNKQLVQFAKYNKNQLILPRVGDLAVDPTVTTKTQLGKTMHIEVQYRFDPMDSVSAHDKIPPGVLYHAETWASYWFELELIWISQERLMVDANWSLIQHIQYANPDEPSGRLDTYKVLSEGQILANRFHQKNVWISSQFSLNVPRNEFNQTGVAPQLIVSQTPFVQLHVTLNHDDAPLVGQQEHPTIVLHSYHYEPLSNSVVKQATYRRTEHLFTPSQLHSIMVETNSAHLPTTTGTTIPTPLDTRLNSALLDDEVQWLNRSIAVSQYRFGDFQMNIKSDHFEMRAFRRSQLAPTPASASATTLPLLPELTDNNSNDVDLYAATTLKLGDSVNQPGSESTMTKMQLTDLKASDPILGHGFNFTFTTDLPLLYPDLSISKLSLDLTGDSQYQFSQWSDNIHCWWNGVELTPANFKDAHGNPIASKDYSTSTGTEGLAFVYQSLEFTLPVEYPIEKTAFPYTFDCSGPIIIPTPSHSGSFSTNSKSALRFRAFYDDGLIPDPSPGQFSHSEDNIEISTEQDSGIHKPPPKLIQLSHYVRLNFGDVQKDEKSFRLFLLIMISIPIAFVLAGALVWKRYSKNKKHTTKRIIVQQPTESQLQESSRVQETSPLSPSFGNSTDYQQLQ